MTADIGAETRVLFSFACDETGRAYAFAHFIKSLQSSLRQYGRKKLSIIFADGKTQVTVEYDGFNPVRVDTVVVSSQHSEDVTMERIESDLKELVIKKIIPHLLDDKTKYYINPTGKFVIGGQVGHRRKKNNSRHVRRVCSPRRRRVLGKRPDKSRQKRMLCGPLYS